ncbi:MAG: hypothetical protein P4M01_07865 [Acidobacteriota bacterium]|nr:hypothetical protein [Acidobacteriota bacterium]
MIRRVSAAGWVACLLLYGCPLWATSSALVETSSRPLPENPSVKLYSGTIPVSSEEVHPSAELTVLLLVDSTDASQAVKMQERVLAVQDALRDRPFRLAMLRGGTLEIFASFTGRAKLRSAMNSVEWPAADRVEGAAILDEILQASSRLGENYAPVLLVGDMPVLDPSVREYGASVLAHSFATQKLRVSWIPGDNSDDQWDSLFLSSGGRVLEGDHASLAAALNDQGKSFVLLTWEPLQPSAGFVAYRASILDAKSQEFMAVPDLAAADTAKFTPAAQYDTEQEHLRLAFALLNRGPMDVEASENIRALLDSSLNENPLDPMALRVAILFCLARKDVSGARQFGDKLVSARPQNGEDLALYGHALVEGKRMVDAERILKRALRLGYASEALYVDLSHARRSQRDDREATEYLAEALKLNPQRQDIWFLRAESAERIPDPALAIECLENGLALGGVHIPEVKSLLRLYAEAGNKEKLAARLEETMKELPAQIEPRTEFASALEELHLTMPALRAWDSVLAVQSDDETAYYRKAALLLVQGDAATAAEMAREGLLALPRSSRLCQLLADALEQQHLFYEARRVLLQGAAQSDDSALLLRAANTQDAFGNGAAEAYLRAASKLAPDSPESMELLQRGFLAALRDGELPQAQRIADLAKAAGNGQLSDLLAPRLASARAVPASISAPLSLLDDATLAELTQTIPASELAEKYSAQLNDYAAALAVQDGSAVVPGGPAAEAIWVRLVGVSPSKPAAYFAALLQRENGRLLAFSFYLLQLDARHQALLTASGPRLSRIYARFVALANANSTAKEQTANFFEALRLIPIDEQGHMVFPGSPQVWMTASGDADPRLAKSAGTVQRVAAPEVEDEILLRLAAEYASTGAGKRSALETYLAVARIDQHRRELLDEESAQLLAQHDADAGSAYAYFTDITALNAADFRQFFAVVLQLRERPALEANFQLGSLHSLLEWIALMVRQGALQGDEAAELFRQVCQRFASSGTGSERSLAALDAAQAILGRCARQPGAASADAKIRACLLETERPRDLSRRNGEYNAVLASQTAPSLDALFTLASAVHKILQNEDVAASVETMRQDAARLSTPESGKEKDVSGAERKAMEAFELAPLNKTLAQLAERVARHKDNARDSLRLTHEVLDALQPQVTAALAAPIYGYFLRPADAMVNDPLLLRKHRYFEFAEGADKKPALTASSFQRRGAGYGSYFRGGFATFAVAAGSAAASGGIGDGTNASYAWAAQLATLRSVQWGGLREDDLRLLTMRVLVGREWIVESAADADLRRALAEETLGRLSLERRARLLNALAAHDWNNLWQTVTLRDLEGLGQRYLARFATDRWNSALLKEARRLQATASHQRVENLGTVDYESFGCTHPHLWPVAHYEEFTSTDALARRMAEFSLYLALSADRNGVEPQALERLAEPLALRTFRKAQMSSPFDWRALLAAFEAAKDYDWKKGAE